MYRSRSVLLVIQVQLFHDQFDQVLRVGGIEDGEVALKAYCLCLVTQDAGEDSVESAHPEPAGTLLTHQLCDT